jgi:hypothetical protein
MSVLQLYMSLLSLQETGYNVTTDTCLATTEQFQHVQSLMQLTRDLSIMETMYPNPERSLLRTAYRTRSYFKCTNCTAKYGPFSGKCSIVTDHTDLEIPLWACIREPLSSILVTSRNIAGYNFRWGHWIIFPATLSPGLDSASKQKSVPENVSGKKSVAGALGWQPHRQLWADCIENLEASTSRNRMDLHGLLRG